MVAANQDATIRRLKKIEGQVRGIIRMIEDDRYCIDILQQVSAVRSALARAESEILKAHAEGCVEQAINRNDADAQRKIFHELVNLFEGVRR